MKRLTGLFALLFLMASCANARLSNQEYKYELKGIAGGFLQLKDKTFEFQYQAGLVSLKSEGDFYIKNDTLYLKSFKDYKTGYLEVTETESKATTNSIKVIDHDEMPFSDIDVKINDNFVYSTGKDGSFNYNLKDKKATKIEILWIELPENNSYIVKNKNANNFKIKLIPIDLEKNYFDNFKIKIHKNYLSIYGKKYIKQ